jgi:hypothetical protein
MGLRAVLSHHTENPASAGFSASLQPLRPVPAGAQEVRGTRPMTPRCTTRCTLGSTGCGLEERRGDGEHVRHERLRPRSFHLWRPVLARSERQVGRRGLRGRLERHTYVEPGGPRPRLQEPCGIARPVDKRFGRSGGMTLETLERRRRSMGPEASVRTYEPLGRIGTGRVVPGGNGTGGIHTPAGARPVWLHRRVGVAGVLLCNGLSGLLSRR